MTNSTLIEDFDNAMMEIYQRALSETGYRASIFLKMLLELHGLETARRLIHSPKISAGYTALWDLDRLDLTVEALIIENTKWHELFSPEELTICRDRLMEYRYLPKEQHASE